MLLIIKINVDIVHNIIHVQKNRHKTEDHLIRSLQFRLTYRHYNIYIYVIMIIQILVCMCIKKHFKKGRNIFRNLMVNNKIYYINR